MRRLTKKGNMNERIDVVLRKFRSRMTSYPPGMCPLALYRSLLQISMNQSCGKCVPCRDGLAEVDYYLKCILNGDATMDILDRMEEKCRMIADTADCAVGIVGAYLILDSLTAFADEYESHIKNGCCAENIAQTIPCVTLCPAHVDVPGYIAMINNGDYAGAVKVIRNRNPFPTACAKGGGGCAAEHKGIKKICGGSGSGKYGQYPEGKHKDGKEDSHYRRRTFGIDSSLFPCTYGT